MKKRLGSTALGPYKEKSVAIKRQLTAENMRQISKTKKNMLLKKVNFKLVDKNFQENFL